MRSTESEFRIHFNRRGRGGLQSKAHGFKAYSFLKLSTGFALAAWIE
jgi:hypothetical protein